MPPRMSSEPRTSGTSWSGSSSTLRPLDSRACVPRHGATSNHHHHREEERHMINLVRRGKKTLAARPRLRPYH